MTETQAWQVLIEAFGDMTERMPCGLVIADGTGVVVLANGMAHTRLGYVQPQLIGTRVDAVTWPDHDGLVIFRQAVNTNSVALHWALLIDQPAIERRAKRRAAANQHREMVELVSTIRGQIDASSLAPPRRRGDGRGGDAVSEQLTPRLREIFRGLLCGESPAELAKRLTISRYTVYNHTAEIRRRLKVRSRAELLQRFK